MLLHTRCMSDKSKNYIVMIKLKMVQRPNPKDATAERKFYVSAKNMGEVSLEAMSENISDRCTLTETDVLAVLSALQREMTKSLMDGRIGRFCTFGSFELSLNSNSVEKVLGAMKNPGREYGDGSDPG